MIDSTFGGAAADTEYPSSEDAEREREDGYDDLVFQHGVLYYRAQSYRTTKYLQNKKFSPMDPSKNGSILHYS
jgi:hypothetical protein